MNGAGKLLWGYYKAGDPPVWLPLQVDANGKVIVDMSAINLDDLADVDTSGVADGDLLYYDSLSGLWIPYKVTGASLSQTFGASATRLRNIIAAPLAGEVLRISNCGGSCFAGVIDDNPAAHGGQGLDATHVPYDGDTYEDMFNGLYAYDGSTYWGQIIVHNKTRSNSRKIVSVDRVNNVIVTTSSTDNWADDDVITTESQTNNGAGSLEFFDIDLSDQIGTGVDAIFLYMVVQNNTVNADANNSLFVHPYATYSAGKRQWAAAQTGNEHSTLVALVDVIDQKITVSMWKDGTDDNYVILAVPGTVEFADT